MNYIMNNKYYNFSPSVFLRYFKLSTVILSFKDVKVTPSDLNAFFFGTAFFIMFRYGTDEKETE